MSTSTSLPADLLTRGVEEIIQADSLKKKLQSGRKLRIKHGVDPTTTDLHLGYAVVYQKLRAFQELGHTIVFLIGDFTARFGDPTDQQRARTLKDKKEVEKLARHYIDQAGLILDISKTEVRRNSEWYDKMSAEELLQLQARFTVAQLMERDMFVERQKAGKEIGYHEPVYPILQAYDSVMLESDLTVIGTDQTFNELQARPLQKENGQEPQEVMSMRLLIGTDGKRKMSQSLGNYIGLTDSPKEMYGKLMSIPDKLIMEYFELATRVPVDELQSIKKKLDRGANPRDIKARLAATIVELYHGPKAASQAGQEFTNVFRKNQTPKDIAEYAVKRKKLPLVDLLVEAKLASSKSEARRLVEQKAVKVDGKAENDWQMAKHWPSGAIIQVGKRKFVKIV
ncbi:MAG: tyrosine--tRNA ligase [bacterium]|nr:tyrosine--tRNA ligase [bacterium]